MNSIIFLFDYSAQTKVLLLITAQLLGFEKFIPPFANINGSDILKGVNYASGGAGIRGETSITLVINQSKNLMIYFIVHIDLQLVF
jgi:hypothetical protein